MPSLNLDLNFFTHPKVRRLVGLLGKNSEVYPLRLWCHVGNYFPEDGILHDNSAQEIESVCYWDGEPGLMVKAMEQVGMIHKSKNGDYKIHDWNEHSGHISAFKKRSIAANKKRWGTYIDPTRTPTRTPKPPPKESSSCAKLTNSYLSPAREENFQTPIPPEFEQLAATIYGGVPTAGLTEALKLYSHEWVKEAMLKSESAGVRNWNHTLKILQRFAGQGNSDSEKEQKNGASGRQSGKPGKPDSQSGPSKFDGHPNA